MIYIYKYAGDKPLPGVPKSFSLAFNKSFNNKRVPVRKQIVYIPKNGEYIGVLTLNLHNVAENTDTLIDVTDTGNSKDYYKIEITGIPNLANGEYIYNLKADKELASEGLAQVMAYPAQWKEEQEVIEYNEYGNRK